MRTANPLPRLGPPRRTRTRASLAAAAQATAKVSSLDPSSTTRTSTSPGPCGNSARKAVSVRGRRPASLKHGRIKLRPGLQGASLLGLVGHGAAGSSRRASVSVTAQPPSDPRPQPRTPQSLARVVRRGHHPCLGPGGNAHRDARRCWRAMRDGVDGCRQTGSPRPRRAGQCPRTASAGWRRHL
jgi:hypothetical protein